MGQHREKIAGNIPSKKDGNILAFTITHKEYLRRVQAAFRSHTGNRPGAADALAAEIECSDKTTKSWLDGRTAPSGILDLRAMNKVPAYAALKREIAAMEANLDPRVQAKVRELHNLTLQLAGVGT